MSTENIQFQFTDGGTAKVVARDVAAIGTAADKSNALTQEMARSLSNLGSVARSTSSPLSTLRGLLAFAGVVGAVQTIRSLIHEMTDFSEALFRAGIAAGQTTEQMRDLGLAIGAIGADTGTGFVEAAKSFEVLAKSGLNAAEATGVLRQSLTLASATGTGAVATSTILARVLNAYKVGAQDAGRVTDQLAVAASNSIGGLEEIGSLLVHLAPAATSAGVSLTETQAAVQVLTRSGLQARQAVSELREAFVALEAPTDNERILLKNAGVDIDKAKISSVGLTGALAELARTGGKLEGLIRGGRVLDIFRSSKVDVADLVKELERADGSAAKFADTFNASLAGSFQNLSGAADRFVNAASGFVDLAGTVNNFAEAIKILAEEVTKLDTGLKGVGVQDLLHLAGLASNPVPLTQPGTAATFEEPGARIGHSNPDTLIRQAENDRIFLQNSLRKAQESGGRGGGIIPAGTDEEFQHVDKAVKSLVETTNSLAAANVKAASAGHQQTAEEIQAQTSAAALSASRRNLVTTENALIQAFNVGTINAVEYAQALEQAEQAAGVDTFQQLELTQFRLNTEFQAGVISLQEYNKQLEDAQVKAGAARTSLEALTAIFPDLDKDILKTADSMNQVLVGGLNRAIDAFADFAATGFKSFSDFKKVLADILLDIGKQILALILKLIILKTIESAFGSATGTTGGLLTTLLGGTATAGKAAGGPALSGQPLLVGERGPEIFRPPSNGTIVPNNQIGGGSPVNVKVINVRDPSEIHDAINTAEGEKTIMNILSRNKRTVQQLAK